MNILRSLFVALAMYSKIPVPQVDWNKKSMAYALAFFPLVGVLCGGLLLLWRWAALALNFGSVLFAAGALLCSVLVTGGIHLDGFCDVTDALSSWQTKERRLEILKDSHIGAFALIGTACYLLAYFACWTEIEPTLDACIFVGLGYVLSRSLNGFSIANLRCAKTSGLAATFAENADRRAVTAALCAWIIVVAGLLLWLNPLWGACGLLLAAGCFLYYRHMAYGTFGGITGDLAGWFLQILELGWLIVLILLQKLA